MAVVAALRAARDLGPDDVVVVLLPDGGRGYLGKIFNDDWMSSYGFLDSQEGGTAGDVLRQKSAGLPALVHTHPTETVHDVIEIMREYGVSQLPVVGAEPPVMAGEIAGAVTERELLDAVFSGTAKMSDAVSAHMGPSLPLVGAGQSVEEARTVFSTADAAVVVEDGKPVGVITRHDLLAYVATHGAAR
jgi:cystathionine beta-synthase